MTSSNPVAETQEEDNIILDFDKICRLCLLEKTSMLRIFAKKKRNNTTPLPIRIMSCASLEVSFLKLYF